MFKLSQFRILFLATLLAISLGTGGVWHIYANAPNPPAGSTVIKSPNVNGTVVATYDIDTLTATVVITGKCRDIDFIVGPRSAPMTQAAFEDATTDFAMEETFLGFNTAPAGCFSAFGGEGLDLDTVVKSSRLSSPEGLKVEAEVVMVGVI